MKNYQVYVGIISETIISYKDPIIKQPGWLMESKVFPLFLGGGGAVAQVRLGEWSVSPLGTVGDGFQRVFLLLKPSEYLEDHPRTCKWLITPIYTPWKGHL